MSDSTDTSRPQLDGYELLDKLGAGGYGEVWSARVPGGLLKAVKVIFGRHDESRAASELKALERIREVRHPFVVSLERIEFSNGRLLVVSELADGSLRDRFRECVKEGMPGIPREELIGYLRDTADALDYLTDKHNLQHLDIKPENLLLLAGHAKVADFGLVKAVGDKTQSLVGGMTPAYAPPEVFQGDPSRQSDQYSLAVLYQELLTGVLPFDGENAAELTLQHMHDEPNLDPLVQDDRFAVSRALSKEPENRYESCTEFVRALQGIGGFHNAGQASAASQPRQVDTIEHATEIFGENVPASNGAESVMKIDLPPHDGCGAQILPSPEFNPLGFEPTPALFIGLGGAAAVVLRELRQKLSERFELAAPLATMPMLLLDTDPKSLMAAGRNAGKGAGLTQEETIALPLRRPQEYRDRSRDILQWLGRRWLYNIPKSLKTEGIRPLGRLALVDHARQAFQRIRRALADCVSVESLGAAQDATGLVFKPGAVRVYIVGSVAGGTASGMSIDVAYAVRNLIARMGIADAKVMGLMATCTSRNSERGELTRVNTFSWIAEHQHFCTPGVAYPGDPSCGLPGSEAGVRPFDAAYLMMMGNRLDDASFMKASASIADYLYSDAATPAQTFLDACRESTESSDPACTLRTFAVNRKEAAPADARRGAEQLLVNRLLDSWIDDPSKGGADKGSETSSTSRVVLGAGELVGRLKLDAASISTMCRSLIEKHVSALTLPSPTSANPIERLEEQNRLFESGGRSAVLGEGAPQVVAGKPIADLVDKLIRGQQGAVAEWVTARVDVPGDRMAGSLRAINWFRDHADSLLAEIQRFAAATQAKIGDVVKSITQAGAVVAEVEDRYLRLKIDLAALEGAAQVAAALRGAMDRLADDLHRCRPTVSDLLSKLQASEEYEPESAYQLIEATGVTPSRLVGQLDARLQEDWISSRLGLIHVLNDASLRGELVGVILRTAQQVVRECLMSNAAAGEATLDSNDWDSPVMAEIGDGIRRCVVLPKGAKAEAANDPDIAVIAGPPGDAYLISEGAALSAPHAAVALVGGRRDYADFAERIHTRRDIQWTDLLKTPSAGRCDEHQAFTVAIAPGALVTDSPQGAPSNASS